MYLDATLRGARLELQEQYDKLYKKRKRQRTKSSEFIPVKKLSRRSIRCNVSSLHTVSEKIKF